MDLDELRTVQAKERRKDSLQHLRDTFYTDVATYIADLRAQRDRRAKQVDDPFSDEGVRRLSDEIETAEEVAEAIYERRVGKVVKLASFAAADMAVEEEGMTDDERRLFDDLVGRIQRNKSTVLDALSGVSAPEELGGESPEPAAVDADEAAGSPTPPGGSAEEDLLADAMGTGDDVPSVDGEREAPPDGPTEPEAEREAVDDDAVEETPALRTDGAAAEPPSSGSSGSNDASGSPENRVGSGTTDPVPDPSTGNSRNEAASAPDRTTVRITADVGSILGVDDREYDLEREDVVTLPSTNADPLLERGAAERLE
ncbi:MAG: hypothetical protein V5A46_09610 [Haloferacaceae archaeon]